MSRKTIKYPEYEPDAIFRCDQGCGEWRRDRCHSFAGHLTCPKCRYRSTLKFTGRLVRGDEQSGSAA